DQLDVFILTSLPIARSKLLLGRVAALAIFFGSILLGANLPGWAGFTGAADLRDAMFALPAAHAVAILMAGLFASAFLVALQGVLVCLFGQRVARRVSPIVQALCVLVLLTLLFLSLLLSHSLDVLLRSNSHAVFWFPPFWFLGLYEHLLHGNATAPVFSTLARIAVRATALVSIVAIVTYPLAYARRVRQIVEGVGMRNPGARLKPFQGLLHATLLREPRLRAIFHFIGQTLWRRQQLRLLLAVFGGLGLAMTISSVLLVRIGHGSPGFAVSPYGMRLAIPVMAFWTVAGLRAAFRTRVAENASWAFWAIHGRPKYVHLRGAETWVATCASAVTLTTAMVLHIFAPVALRSPGAFTFQMLIAIAASVLLTDAFFLNARAIPFTKAQGYSVGNLSLVVITYFVLFPAFALGLVATEPWMEANRFHLVIATGCAVAIHIMLRRAKAREVDGQAGPLEMDEVILRPGEMGLRS